MDGYVFSGRHTNVQYVHEMRLNITNSQGNANQNCIHERVDFCKRLFFKGQELKIKTWTYSFT